MYAFDCSRCYNFTLTEKLLALPAVRSALNVGTRKWVDCNRLVDLELVFAGNTLHFHLHSTPPPPLYQCTGLSYENEWCHPYR
jgi:hypothetical protein